MGKAAPYLLLYLTSLGNFTFLKQLRWGRCCCWAVQGLTGRCLPTGSTDPCHLWPILENVPCPGPGWLLSSAGIVGSLADQGQLVSP